MYDDSNIFAKILRGEIPCKKIYEDDYVIAIEDIAPAAPIHVLVIPKTEYMSFNDFSKDASDKEVAAYFRSMQKIATKLGLEDNGYRIVSNHGSDAAQTVPHLHFHILGGKQLADL
jgi:histidine triad (HIT) family protein